MAKKKQHSEKYELLSGYYKMGLWNKERLKHAVIKERITSAEYKEITGEAYE